MTNPTVFRYCKPRYLLLLIAFSEMGLSASAQTFSWARQFNLGNSSFYGTRSGLDAAGNFYAAGTNFVVKVSAEGTTVWSRQFSTASSFGISSMVTDQAGNVYITGRYSGVQDLDPSSMVYNLASLGGSDDIFVVKLDNNGNFVWANSIGGPVQENSSSIAVDGTGNILLAGFYGNHGPSNPGGSCDFDPGPGMHTLTSAGNSDFFVEKMDNNGNFLWVYSAGNSDPGNSIQVLADVNGNIFVCGSFRGTMSFDGTNYVTASSSSGTNFLEKLDPNGSFIWVKQMISNCCFDVTGMTSDASGNIYASAYFSGTVDMDPGPGVYNITGPGTQNGCVVKYNNNGELTWAKAFVSNGSDQADGLCVDGYGNVYIGGLFSGTGNHDFNPGPATYNMSCGTSPDMYLVKLDVNGNFKWAIQVGGGNNSSALAHALQVNNLGQIYAPVRFSGSVDFNPSKSNFNLNSTNGGFALLKLTQSNGGANRGEELTTTETITNMLAFPNPSQGSFIVKLPDLEGAGTIRINDILGRTVYEEKITATDLLNRAINISLRSKGIYTLVIKDGFKQYMSKIIVQ